LCTHAERSKSEEARARKRERASEDTGRERGGKKTIGESIKNCKMYPYCPILKIRIGPQINIKETTSG